MSYLNELKELCDNLECKFIPDCGLKEYTTFKFGGPCRALISINSTKSVSAIVRFLKEKKLKFRVIGRGSNIIVSDEGYDGIVLFFGHDFAYTVLSGSMIECEAGTLLASACVLAQQNGFTGMENLFGIPGTLGGALYMNAGAYGSEISDIAHSAKYVDGSGEVHTIELKKSDFSYRKSIFTDSDKIITGVTLSLEKGNSDEIRERMTECMAKRTAKQPLEYPSAGSTFKRPEGSYASLLIDQCGLKGLTCGGAMVSEKHSGFVINKGYATCADVLELCDKVKKIVKEKTGYVLELEPIILK